MSKTDIASGTLANTYYYGSSQGNENLNKKSGSHLTDSK